MFDGSENLGNDMPSSWRDDVIIAFGEAISKYDSEKEIAQEIKDNFQSKYGQGSWHCVVGKSFGSSVTYDKSTHLTLEIGRFMIELWRCG